MAMGLMTAVQFPVQMENFLFTTSKSPLVNHSASYPMGTRGSFPRSKAAGVGS